MALNSPHKKWPHCKVLAVKTYSFINIIFFALDIHQLEMTNFAVGQQNDNGSTLTVAVAPRVSDGTMNI